MKSSGALIDKIELFVCVCKTTRKKDNFWIRNVSVLPKTYRSNDNSGQRLCQDLVNTKNIIFIYTVKKFYK